LAITQTQGSITNASFTKVAQGISNLRNIASSNPFAGRAADALQTLTDRMVTGANPLSSGSKDQAQRDGGAMYLFRNTSIISAHQILAREDTPYSSPFSSFLSWVMAEVTKVPNHSIQWQGFHQLNPLNLESILN
jgi:hypothetical protein